MTLAFGAWYGTSRVIEDFLRIDKRIFGMTGSQWTGLAVAIVCAVTLLVWARRGRAPGGIDPLADREAEPVEP
jgi:hypothetical protein